jgi:hypothetical protein
MEPTYRRNLSHIPCDADGLEPYVQGVRFLLYSSRGLVDADLPGEAALRERLRQMAGQPGGLSGVYVLVFDAATDRYLGRCDIVVDDGEPVLVGPAVGC